MRNPRAVLCSLLALVGAASCGGPKPAPPASCDASCQDTVAIRGLRETMKLAYNLTVQGKPVGDVDVKVPCLRGGSARVHGNGSSNALQGTTEVHLTFELDRCAYQQKDPTPENNYDLTVSGTIAEDGALSAAAGSTTALVLKGADLSVTGTVYDPALPYDANACALEAVQDGNHLGGTFCGRKVTISF